MSLPLAGHTFLFRRLTWRDEVAFARKNPEASRLHYVAQALESVDGRKVSGAQGVTILSALPRPIADRVVIFYMGSLPGRRILTTEFPYVAPEPHTYQGVVDTEAESLADTEEEILERRFGSEDVAAAKELAHRMVEGTHYAGVSRSLEGEDTELAISRGGRPTEGGDVDEGPVQYHAVVS